MHIIWGKETALNSWGRMTGTYSFMSAKLTTEWNRMGGGGRGERYLKQTWIAHCIRNQHTLPYYKELLIHCMQKNLHIYVQICKMKIEQKNTHTLCCKIYIYIWVCAHHCLCFQDVNRLRFSLCTDWGFQFVHGLSISRNILPQQKITVTYPRFQGGCD